MTAVNVAKIGGSVCDNGNRCYMSDNLQAVDCSAWKNGIATIAIVLSSELKNLNLKRTRTTPP